MGSVGKRTVIPQDSSDEPGLDSSAPSIDLFLPYEFDSSLSLTFSFLTISGRCNSIKHDLISSTTLEMCFSFYCTQTCAATMFKSGIAAR